jgi:beta-galactosidase
MPEYLVANVSDATNLRWAARSDGTAAYVFISTVQPFVAMQAVPAVRLQLLLANAVTVEIPVPASPGIDIPANTSTMWPVRMPLANGLGLMYATATPLGVVPSLALGDVSVFYATSGVRTEFVFNATSASSGAITVGVCAGACTTEGGLLFLRSLPSGLGVAFTLLSSLSEVLMTVLLLDDVTSTRAWIAPLAGATRLMISDALPTFLIASPSAPTSLTVISEGAGASVPFWLFPSPSTVQLASGVVLSPTTEGIFTQYTIPALPAVPVAVQATLVALAQGPPRVIPKGANGVAAAPNQDGSLGEFARAQVYALSFTIPGGSVPPSADLRLVVRYEGDCARLYAGTGTEREDIVEDHFFNGHEFEFPLTRNGFDLTTNLTLRILPKAAVQGQGVYFEVQPAFNASGIAVGLTSVGIVSAFSTALTAAA